MSTPAEQPQWWHDQRAQGIGGSEAASVVGASKHRGRLELWGLKTSRIKPDDLTDNDAVIWGCLLEDVIAKEYSRRTGRKIRRAKKQKVHKLFPWMRCFVDREVYDAERGKGVLQIKACGLRMSDQWKNPEEWDGEGLAPLPYMIQIQHEMMVTGVEWGALACLIGGQKFVYFDVERNKDFCDYLAEEEREFWSYVDSDTPPPPETYRAVDNVALGKLYRDDSGPAIILPDIAIEIHDERVLAMEKIAEFTNVKNECSAKIKGFLGDSARGTLPDGSVSYQWKNVTKKVSMALKDMDEETRAKAEKIIKYRELRKVSARI